MNDKIKEIKEQYKSTNYDLIGYIIEDMIQFMKSFREFDDEINQLDKFIDKINIDREEDKEIQISRINKTVERYNYLISIQFKTQSKFKNINFEKRIERDIQKQLNLIDLKGEKTYPVYKDKLLSKINPKKFKANYEELFQFDKSRFESDKSVKYQEKIEKVDNYLSQCEGFLSDKKNTTNQMGCIAKYSFYFSLFIVVVGIIQIIEGAQINEKIPVFIIFGGLALFLKKRSSSKPKGEKLKKLNDIIIVRDYLEERKIIYNNLIKVYNESDLLDHLQIQIRKLDDLKLKLYKYQDHEKQYYRIIEDREKNYRSMLVLLAFLKDETIINSIINDSFFKNGYSTDKSPNVENIVTDGIITTNIRVRRIEDALIKEYPVIKWKRVVEYEEIPEEDLKKRYIDYVYKVAIETIITNLSVGFIGNHIINLYQFDFEREIEKNKCILSINVDEEIIKPLLKDIRDPRETISQLVNNVNIVDNEFSVVEPLTASGPIRNIENIDYDSLAEEHQRNYKRLEELVNINSNLYLELEYVIDEMLKLEDLIIQEYEDIVGTAYDGEINVFDDDIEYINSYLSDSLNLKRDNYKQEKDPKSSNSFFFNKDKYPLHSSLSASSIWDKLKDNIWDNMSAKKQMNFREFKSQQK